MTKFHINAKGVPAPCKAQKGNCPFGGSTGTDNHFDTAEQAQEFIDKQNEENHGWLAKSKPSEPGELITPELRKNLESNLSILSKYFKGNRKGTISTHGDKIFVGFGKESTFELQMWMDESLNVDEIIVKKGNNTISTKSQGTLNSFMNLKGNLHFVNWLDNTLDQL